MTTAIVEVKTKLEATHFYLEWGMLVEDGRPVWDAKTLEVRLYGRPYPAFGTPELLNTDLKNVGKTSGTGGSVKVLSFFDWNISRETSRPAFRPGTVAADSVGRYYPAHFDLDQLEVSAGSVVLYPALRWSAPEGWLDKPIDLWVVFGYEGKDGFIPVHQEKPIEHRPEDKPRHPSLPDADLPTVARSDRAKHRGASKRIFVSYSHSDSYAVNQIVKRLSHEFYFDVWIDYDSIPGGSQWQSELAKGIQSSEVVLFMLTPAASASEWCLAELAHARKHGKPIIPLRITGTADNTHLDQAGLTGIHWIDFAQNESKAWDDLLKQVPTPLERDHWRFNPQNWERHQRYLQRMIINKLNKASLADITDEPPKGKRSIELLDIYVPLPVDMSVTVKVSEEDRYTIQDWWVKTERSETLADEATPEELRGKQLKEWYALKVERSGLELILSDFQNQMKERVQKDSTYQFRTEQNWYMEAHDAANVQPRMVLTGNPGSGKSTFLKHLAVCLAGDQLEHERANIETLNFWTLPAYTPIFVSLRDLVTQQFPNPAVVATSQHFEDYLMAMLKDAKQAHYFDDLRRQLENGDAIILLDGLDEVPDAVTQQRRDQIIDFVDDLQTDFAACRIIITSRPYAYNGDWQLNGFGQTALIPLHDHRIYELAQALYAYVLPDDADANKEAETFVRSLMARVKDHELRNTPLLFTMFAALWLGKVDRPPAERIPERISQLYRESVDLMLTRWTKKDLETGKCVADLLELTPEQLRQALEEVAFEVQSEKGSQPRADFRMGVLMEAMHVVKGSNVPHIQEALDYLEQRAGILTSEAPRHYRFTHLSFQEHLAACYLAVEERYPTEIVNQIRRAAGRWRNVVPLLADEIAAAKRDLYPLVQALLNIAPDPLLAKDAAEWELIDYANTIIDEFQVQLTDADRTSLRQRILATVQKGALPAPNRAKLGQKLAELGDPRPGVGTTLKNGIELPDIAWCEVPQGEFVFGDDDKDAYPSYAHPADKQKLTLPAFYIARYPVTYAQFETFIADPEGFGDVRWWAGLADDEYRHENQSQPGEQSFPYANHPRENVSWYDALAFCRWLSWRLGGGYALDNVAAWAVRLPTEAEWEKAARGSDGLIYPYGNTFDASKGNTSETGIGQTSAVGLFVDGGTPYEDPAYDMSGNVWEWCLSGYIDKYSHHEAAEVDLTSADPRRLRGGSWGNRQDGARAAYRDPDNPFNRYSFVGFRLCCVRPPSPNES